jgi:hypothetical protein
MSEYPPETARSTEAQAAQESNAPGAAQPVQPHVAEAAAEVFRDLLVNFGALNQSTEQANTSFIAYMDRIILLSGGTLTLTFTAIATISEHLKNSNQSAVHIPFVVIACWLLVSTILLGLGYNRFMIMLRHQQGLQNTFTAADAKMKLKLLSYPWVQSVEAMNAINAIPPTVDLKPIEKKVKRLKRIAGWAGALSHLTLVGAFVFLTLFIESNIVGMLSH